MDDLNKTYGKQLLTGVAGQLRYAFICVAELITPGYRNAFIGFFNDLPEGIFFVKYFKLRNLKKNIRGEPNIKIKYNLITSMINAIVINLIMML